MAPDAAIKTEVAIEYSAVSQNASNVIGRDSWRTGGLIQAVLSGAGAAAFGQTIMATATKARYDDDDVIRTATVTLHQSLSRWLC